MSIKGDLIAVALAGAVVVAAGWYAKRRISAMGGEVKQSVVGAVNWLGQPVDGFINAAGQLITGDDGWSAAGGHSPQYKHQFDANFGVTDLEW